MQPQTDTGGPQADCTSRACRFATLPAVMSEEEMSAEIDPVYAKFLAGEVEVPGRDLCDMSGAKVRAAAASAHEVPSRVLVLKVMDLPLHAIP